MATKKVVCDTDVMIDFWDVSSVRHLKTKSVLENNIGATITLEGDLATALLSETPGRVVVAVHKGKAQALIALASKHKIAMTRIGDTGGQSLTINDVALELTELRAAFTGTFPKLFG